MKITYESNNSGGHWWLTDDDWISLANAGWDVAWFKDSDTYDTDKDGKWLGALASRASKDFPDREAAIHEWEMITGAFPYDQGCPCCGDPHGFYAD